MSPIEAYPQIAYLGKGKGWVLTEELHYTHDEYGLITVPKGFRTDLDSIPRLPLAYWLTKNASVVGAIVHDYLYKQGSLRGNGYIKRSVADDIMYDIMEEEGVSWWQKRMIRFGLRIGGWLAWNKHREVEKRRAAMKAVDGHNPPPPREPPPPPSS